MTVLAGIRRKFLLSYKGLGWKRDSRKLEENKIFKHACLDAFTAEQTRSGCPALLRLLSLRRLNRTFCCSFWNSRIDCGYDCCLFVFVFVCLPASIFPKMRLGSSPSFACYLTRPATLSSSDGVAMRYTHSFISPQNVIAKKDFKNRT